MSPFDAYIERIFQRVTYDHGCWTFAGRVSPTGYGRLGVKGGAFTQVTHRAVYEYFNGPVPRGADLDHLCRNRACCNPAHLEVVTHEENMRRIRRTHCRRGHEFTDENTIRMFYPNGKSNGRTCRTCSNDNANHLQKRSA